MRKFYWMLLVLMVLVGCSDESTEDEEKAIVKPDTGSEKEIVWEKDGKEMIVIPTGDFRMGDSKGGRIYGGCKTRPYSGTRCFLYGYL